MATGVLDLLVNLAVEHRPRHGLIVGVERGFAFEFNRGPRGLDLVGSDPSKRPLGRAEATREHHRGTTRTATWNCALMVEPR